MYSRLFCKILKIDVWKVMLKRVNVLEFCLLGRGEKLYFKFPPTQQGPGYLESSSHVQALPDWKVCSMRRGSLLNPNFLRGCICVTKQLFNCFHLLFYKFYGWNHD